MKMTINKEKINVPEKIPVPHRWTKDEMSFLCIGESPKDFSGSLARDRLARAVKSMEDLPDEAILGRYLSASPQLSLDLGPLHGRLSAPQALARLGEAFVVERILNGKVTVLEKMNRAVLVLSEGHPHTDYFTDPAGVGFLPITDRGRLDFQTPPWVDRLERDVTVPVFPSKGHHVHGNPRQRWGFYGVSVANEELRALFADGACTYWQAPDEFLVVRPGTATRQGVFWKSNEDGCWLVLEYSDALADTLRRADIFGICSTTEIFVPCLSIYEPIPKFGPVSWPELGAVGRGKRSWRTPAGTRDPVGAPVPGFGGWLVGGKKYPFIEKRGERYHVVPAEPTPDRKPKKAPAPQKEF